MHKPTRSKTALKPQPLPPLQTDADAVEAVKRLGEVMRHMERAEAAFADESAVLAQRMADAMLPINTMHEQLVASLERYCTEHRDRLTGGGASKTIAFATGTCSWRSRPASVVLKRGFKVEDVIAAIELKQERDDRFAAFLRESVALDKEAMKKDPVAAQTIDGVRIRSAGEDFYVEPLGPGNLSPEVQS